jgi:RNA recognition motif-containing protein
LRFLFMNIYVGNLLRAAKEEEVRDLYSQYGDVTSVRIMVDKFTNQGRGFAFVEMATDEQGRAAIEATNGLEFLGRTLRVSEARPREERSGNDRGGSRGGFGGDRGGSRGGFGGDRGGSRGGFGGDRGGSRGGFGSRSDRY